MTKGYLYAIISAVIYGCMPLMAKYVYADGVNPITLVFLRNAISLLPLALLAYRQNKSLKIPAKKLPGIALMAVLGCCLTPILLFSSYQYIGSGTATVIHFAYPAVIVIGQMLFLRKKPHLRMLLSVALCAVGISLFYSPQQKLDLTGCLLAFSSGVSFSAYVIMLSRFDRQGIPGFLFNFYVTVVCSIVSFLLCICTDALALPATAFGWGICILFSLSVTTGAVVLFQQSTFRIGSERAAILSTLEPITSLVIGVSVFREAMSLQALIGTVLVLSASVLIAFFDFKAKKDLPL